MAGILGPTNRTASMSPEVNDPGFRNVSFDGLKAAYAEAVRGLLDGGSDLLMVETIFDTLNCKAALVAIEEHFERYRCARTGDDLRHHHRLERPHPLRPDRGSLLEFRASRAALQHRLELRPGC